MRKAREECTALWARWGVHLHNIQFKQARREWFVWSNTEMNRGHVFLSFFIQIRAFTLHSFQAQLLIWQAIFMLELNSSWQILKVVWVNTNISLKAASVHLFISQASKGIFFVLKFFRVKPVEFCATTFKAPLISYSPTCESSSCCHTVNKRWCPPSLGSELNKEWSKP